MVGAGPKRGESQLIERGINKVVPGGLGTTFS